MEKPIVYVVSDSVGETAELVVKAALSQYNLEEPFALQRVPYVENTSILEETLKQASERPSIIAFTMVNPDFRAFLTSEAQRQGIPCIDLMGPLMDAMADMFHQKPKLQPGLVHRLDEDYFRRIEAIEFAVRYDDGRDPRGIARADIVLIGVSRTSKTPLSQYLAHKRLKVANVPIVPEVDPPRELFQVDPSKCIGLRISPEKLNDIRKERLKALGLGDQASYANIDRINHELEHFDKIAERIGCRVIDVSNKAVEETANSILTVRNQQD
ncbi:pyruvate, water dikinase regulatory protein [Terribacillus saccharophilus]|uniref:Putative pyruvate, phosphate dikinase regulatory protein n=1 Tax=Terribacillus saccharophilus TaxID=361277 RepID=A0A268ACJ0_9BACI|nr:pyruvate, water dikinase regulatory protein [Terribacillus saccharophilus]PAD21835.1 phosphoenolpyruvate synthase regulatory protein [Terribacillus saccharophilus]PAF19663.1 phosphoenolpyruvate synthase regulatory protein [Terribacillus saccharophilus]PAF21871.1 phosphoenolpyruvate synthase regulatory protein [Terribacillus saccharophilus]PAF38869.1 phosphoenolpyruvate synthase regulatory protein [Terribacillus saccharophilus]PAF40928.1 phosphoenolpyruvate synthase regulatory protein [Terri